MGGSILDVVQKIVLGEKGKILNNWRFTPS